MRSTPRKINRKEAARKRPARPTIGMFINGLEGFEHLHWLGAMDAAAAQQVNLLCFVGKQLDNPYRPQANVIYDLASAERLDGLLFWTTTLQQFISRQKMEAFFQRYRPLPMVSAKHVLPGIPSLVVDDKNGMRAAVSHLIEVHGYRRIAFIPGPEDHPLAQERYQGYVEALVQHGLPLDPSLVSSHCPGWRPEEASAAVHELLDQHAGLEAIVAANDNMVLGVLFALQARQIQVPSDLAVVGFDNSMNINRPDLGLNSTSGDPAGATIERAVNIRATLLPLTTVRTPFYEIGWQAVELLLAQMRGEAVAPLVTMVPELLVRRSCGCFSPTSRPLGSMPIETPRHEPPREAAIAEAITAQRAQIVAQLHQAMGRPLDEIPPDWADRLVAAFVRDVLDEAPAALPAALDELVRASVRNADSLQQWWRVVLALRRQTLPYLATKRLLERIEDLWQRIHVLMEEMTERFYAYQQLLVEKRDQIMREIGQKLITTFDIGQLVDILAQALSTAGIPSCYLALYEHGEPQAAPVARVGYPTESARAVLVYEQQQRVDIANDEAVFRSRLLVPGQRLQRGQSYSMVVEPLYFKDQQLGFVLFEVGPRIGWIYEALQGQLSSSLQGALLMQQTQAQNRLLHQEIGQRQQVEAALQQAHDELELRVARRTAELARANEILTEQIIERERAEERQARLEAQLRQAQKMEAIGRLAGGIAHDFNNLLVIINGNSDLLLSDLAEDDPLRKDIEQIQQAGERAAALTRQLLVFSRQQVLQPRILSLNYVVTNVERMLRRLIGEDIKLVTSLDPTLELITADPGQIEQIIVNLAINARDAMPDGGQLTIETANVDLDTGDAGHAAGAQTGQYVRLRITDTGVGMDAATQARVFEPFFTTKPQGKGTGLGLATVFGIVQQSGGQITVASELGRGTSFTIYLPRAARTREETEPDRRLPRAALTGSETILLVEDDAAVRMATQRFLEEHGYTVIEASHGLEALRFCQQHSGPIDLVITDVVMPGMSGRELAERLASIRPQLPVLYVSGYTDSTILHHGMAENSIALLHKPFTAEVLARKVRELLDRSHKA